MKLLRVHHVQVTIPVGEEQKAREFYCTLLGLREIPKPSNLLKRGGLWIELEGIQIHIGAYDLPKTAGSKEHVAFLVDSLDEWRVRLKSSQIEVIDGTPVPGLIRFDIRDPFDNRIEFLQNTSV